MGDAMFVQKLIDVKEAYDVLADPNNRKHYDFNLRHYKHQQAEAAKNPKKAAKAETTTGENKNFYEGPRDD